MDHQQFDDFARACGRGLRRRSVLRGFAALVLGAVSRNGLPVAAQETCAEPCEVDEICQGGICIQTCAIDRDCRSKKKDDPCLLKMCIEGLCTEAIIDCQPGYECCQGACCEKSCDVDDECAIFDPCRLGRCLEGVCTFIDIEPCVTCLADVDCTPTAPTVICCAGVCRLPCPPGTMMSKGCECLANESGIQNGLIVQEDASGSDGRRQQGRNP
jgi:hypothetical protein